jgi:membrane protein DedA with SNARE-associated domain
MGILSELLKDSRKELSMDNKQSGAVAIVPITLVGLATVAAIIKYPTPEEALKLWAALVGIVGVLTGAFVSYFFTRVTVQTATQQVNEVKQLAENEKVRLERAISEAKDEVRYEKARAEQAVARNAVVQ